jgi:hypothetical protein
MDGSLERKSAVGEPGNARENESPEVECDEQVGQRHGSSEALVTKLAFSLRIHAQQARLEP